MNSGRVDIGDVSRDPIIGVDPHGLVFTKIARDGVCLITNPANPLSNLNQQTVQQIFTGQVRNWSEVPGASVTGPTTFSSACLPQVHRTLSRTSSSAKA